MDSRWISYVYCFNEQADYFECHEYGESLWLDSGRPTILKGFIQAAVCLYHLRGGNARGGWRMWNRAREYLSQATEYEGVDVTQLIADIDGVWECVPTDWRRQSLGPNQVKSLNLPTVKLRLTDEYLAGLMNSWELPPHQGE